MEIRKRPPAQNMGRILAGGMAAEDFIVLMNRTELNCETFEKASPEDAEDFVAVCEELGDKAIAYAEEHEKLGHKQTASDYYFNACSLFRIADYGIRGVNEEKFRIYGKLVDSFHKSKELTCYEKVEFVEVPFEGNSMPGYLVLPDHIDKETPVIIYVPGATGFKEENYTAPKKLWERGAVSIIFDGPGQGEALLNRNMYLTADNYDRAIKAVVDFIKEDGRFGNKIGLMGVSYGGYLAASGAIYCGDDIKALVSRGGCSKTDQLTMHPFAGIDNFYLNGFLPKFHVTDPEEAAAISHQMDIEDKLYKIKCPLLVQHTEKDPIIGTEGAKALYHKSSSEVKEYWEHEGSMHCANDIELKACAYAVDWILDHLK